MIENDAILSQVILTKLGTKMEVIDNIIIFDSIRSSDRVV